MESYRHCLRIYLVILVLVLASMYALSSWHNLHYPATITNSISLDAKLKFLRDNRQLLRQAKTVVLGSSLCLNNIDTDYLHRTLPHQGPFINVAAWGLQVGQARQLYQFTLRQNSGLKRVLYITQAADFSQHRPEALFDAFDTAAYVNHTENLLFPAKYFNARTIWGNIKSYGAKQSTREYGSLAFGLTGSVLLDVRGRHRNQNRWDGYGLDITLAPQEFQELRQFCGDVKGKGQDFIVVTTPVRGHFLESGPSKALQVRLKQEIAGIVRECGGTLIEADREVPLSDDDFADTMHLNNSGASAVARYLAPLLGNRL